MPISPPSRPGLQRRTLRQTRLPNRRISYACRSRAEVSDEAMRMSVRIAIGALVALALAGVAWLLWQPRTQPTVETTPAAAPVLNTTTQFLLRGEYLARI